MEIKPLIVKCFLVLRIMISSKGIATCGLVLPGRAIEGEIQGDKTPLECWLWPQVS